MVEMFLFNEAISNLGLVELPLLGRQFTWTNKQISPLLERLDWFFTSAGWTVKYPNTVVKYLIMETSGHWLCVIEINSKIPKEIFSDLKIIGYTMIASFLWSSRFGHCNLNIKIQ